MTHKPICVLVDTNRWRSSLLLRTPAAAALMFAVSQAHGALGLPEVVEREVVKHGIELGWEARERVHKSLADIRALVGSTPEVRLPTDQQLTSAVASRLEDLEAVLLRVPFTVDVALRALDRVDMRRPPAHTGQQYKDAVIWEVVLDLAQDYSIHLVSGDQAFFKDSNTRKGLEPRLAEECQDRGVEVHLHESLGACLDAITDNVAGTLDARAAVDAIAATLEPELRERLEREGAVLGQRGDSRLRAFVTEVPGRLSLAFELQFGMVRPEQADLSGETQREGQVSVAGECLYRPESQRVQDVSLGSLATREFTEAGLSEPRHVVFGSGRAGRRERVVEYTVLEPLPGGGDYAVLEVPESSGS